MEPVKRCDSCRFWSEMIAYSHGGGPVMALCLGEGGPQKGKYKPPHGSCPGWKKKTEHGAVDEPPDYGETARAAYIAEEGPEAVLAAS
jgi:hypothetical protein